MAWAFLAAAWLAGAVFGAPGSAAAAEKVVVAITSPQSGPQSAWGIELIRGAELALAEYDPKSLKFTYEILPMDDAADPKVGITIANKLKVDKDVMAGETMIDIQGTVVAVHSGGLTGWLGCALDACTGDLSLIAGTLRDLVETGTCNRPDQTCIFYPEASSP